MIQTEKMYKNRETSQAAAAAIAPGAENIRRKVMEAINASGNGLTADECAEVIVLDKLGVRPRVSELAGKGYLQDSGLRRRNTSGRSAIVWIIKGNYK